MRYNGLSLRHGLLCAQVTMSPRPAVLKTDYPMRIAILSERSEPKDLSSPAARLPGPSVLVFLSSNVQPTLVPRIRRSPVRGFWSLLLHGSRITDHGSPFCISFTINTCETPRNCSF